MTEQNPKKIPQKSPYVINVEPRRYSWCTCGYSATQPFCDGAHRESGTGLKSFKIEFTEPKTVAFCGCKQTQTPPFCDGSHSQLSDSN